MTYNIIPDDEALSTCASCQKEITDETDIVALGVRFMPNVDLSDYESHCIEIEMKPESPSAYMMVTADRSEAKQEGKDGLFLLCSQSCAAELKQTLQDEIDQGKLIQSIKD